MMSQSQYTLTLDKYGITNGILEPVHEIILESLKTINGFPNGTTKDTNCIAIEPQRTQWNPWGTQCV